MHMADSLVCPYTAATMLACSAAVAVVAYRKTKKDLNKVSLPMAALCGALVFALQMMNFTIPGTGSSGHLCGGILLAAVLGPYLSFLIMGVILTVQCFLFADGGIMALGANIWNMGFYGCFVGGFLLRDLFLKNGYSPLKLVTGTTVASVLSLQLGAFSVTLETLSSGITALPFGSFCAKMLPIHLAIGVGEGIITSAILLFIAQTRSSLMWSLHNAEIKMVLSARTIYGVMSVACIVTAGLLSYYASSYPDGLEWSIEQLNVADLESVTTFFADIQDLTAFMPDYAFNEEGDFAGLAGVIGTLLVAAAGYGVSKLAVNRSYALS